MTELLSLEQYKKIAKSLRFSSQALINGELTDAVTTRTIKTINPATGELLAEVAACDMHELEQAVHSARVSFDSGEWSRQHPSARKATLLKWVALIREHADKLAVLESLDSGKPIKDCVTIDLPETIHCLSWYAEAIDKYYGEISPSGDENLGLITKEPKGIVAAVLPWNFPLLMMAWKVGPALASGNSVIVKPAEQTSLTAIYLAELALKAGIPAGTLQVLPGLGETIGQAIGLHEDIDIVSFTGSTEVGALFLEYSAQSNLKQVVLECGGKSPSVVLSSASDIKRIANQIISAAFWNMGENCTANSRLIVHQDHIKALTAEILEQAAQLKTGNPLDPANDLGAMISKAHMQQVLRYIEIGGQEGGNQIAGGDAVSSEKGYFIEPTIFDCVTPEMTIAKDEIFGPVLGILIAQSDEDAIQLANNTTYGLQASVYSDNLSHALQAAKQIKAGTVSVNCYGEGDITTPFGGYKQSGFGGRDNGLQAFDQYTETKTIWVALS